MSAEERQLAVDWASRITQGSSLHTLRQEGSAQCHISRSGSEKVC